MEDHETGEDGLERSVHVLLSRAYQPIECRSEFRSGLLDTLKDKQRTRSSRRTRRRRLLRLFGGVSAMAAAAAVVVSLMPSAAVETPLVAPPKEKMDSIAMTPTIPMEPTEEALQLMRDRELAKGASPTGARNVVLVGKGNKLNGIARNQDVRLDHGGRLCVPAESAKSVELWMSKDVVMVAKPGVDFSNEDGALRVTNGSLRLKLKESAPVLDVLLPEYKLTVLPGCDVIVRVQAGKQYAVDGAPAPYVAVLSGQVQAVGPRFSGELLAGHSYDLFDNFVTGPVGQPIRGFKSPSLNRSTDVSAASLKAARSAPRAKRWTFTIRAR